MKIKSRFAALMLLSAAFFLLWKTGLPTDDAAPRVGAKVPVFEPTGAPMIINFWATWCISCVIEMPLLQGLYESGIHVIGINAGNEDQDIINDWVTDAGIVFPIVRDKDRNLEGQFRIKGLPTTFFVDAEGRIQYIQQGALTEESLQNGLASIGFSH